MFAASIVAIVMRLVARFVDVNLNRRVSNAESLDEETLG